MKDASPTEPDTSERAALRRVAQLLGELLLRELDARRIEQLREPGLVQALGEIAIELPDPSEEELWIEARAADYHDLFLRPETGPLVQSLWTQGRYEGDATVRVRQLAAAAGLEFQRSEARGAAPDHLGSLLLLWSRSDALAGEVADEIVRSHLAWALPALERIESARGFYGAVAAASASLILSLTEAAPRTAS